MSDRKTSRQSQDIRLHKQKSGRPKQIYCEDRDRRRMVQKRERTEEEGDESTDLASRARAMTPATMGAETDVPVWLSVQRCRRSVVTCVTKNIQTLF